MSKILRFGDIRFTFVHRVCIFGGTPAASAELLRRRRATAWRIAPPELAEHDRLGADTDGPDKCPNRCLKATCTIMKSNSWCRLACARTGGPAQSKRVVHRSRDRPRWFAEDTDEVVLDLINPVPSYRTRFHLNVSVRRLTSAARSLVLCMSGVSAIHDRAGLEVAATNV